MFTYLIFLFECAILTRPRSYFKEQLFKYCIFLRYNRNTIKEPASLMSLLYNIMHLHHVAISQCKSLINMTLQWPERV
jgi:hypothetical protein